MGKGGEKKNSQRDQHTTQQQPSTSNGGTNTTSVFPPRDTGMGGPHVQCSAYGGNHHFGKDCHQDNFCNRCRSRLHATHMCQAPTNTGKSNTICMYCGSKYHTSYNCTSQPNNNREEPRSTPRDLHSLGSHLGASTGNLVVTRGNTWKSTHFRPAPTENWWYQHNLSIST